MKNTLFAFLLWSAFAAAQKVTIDTDFMITRTDFNIDESYTDSKYVDKYKANLIIDEVTKEETDIYILIRGFAIWGLHINFSKNGIKPVYYHWNDGGGHETILEFDSFELTLNSSNYKVNDLLMGKFKGIATETRSDGKIIKHHLNGKFKHIFNNTRETTDRQQKEYEEALSKKVYRQTGLYYRIPPAEAKKMYAYELVGSGNEYYLYASPRDWVTGMKIFYKASTEPDPKKPGIMLIKLKPEDPKSLQELTQSYIKYGLIIDDVLWHVGDGLTVKDGYVVFPLKIKKDKATELTGRLNFAIQKDKKDHKKLQYMSKHPE